MKNYVKRRKEQFSNIKIDFISKQKNDNKLNCIAT